MAWTSVIEAELSGERVDSNMLSRAVAVREPGGNVYCGVLCF